MKTLTRRRKVALAAALAVPILTVGGLTAAKATTPSERPPECPAAQRPAAPDLPNHLALVFIPKDWLGWYRQWNTQCPGISWRIAAAIGQVTTGHGRLGTAIDSGVNPDGTAGPMQLGIGGAAGDTWVDFRLDGDGDGIASVYNPPDAIRGAYHYLCDLGADQPGRLQAALHAYLGSDEDVDKVLRVAEQYRQPLAEGLDEAALALLDNPRVRLSLYARWDLADGRVDQRISRLLSALAKDHTLRVGLFKAHPEPVTGPRIPAHDPAQGAVNLTKVNGQPVSADNAAARELLASLNELPPELRPDVIDSPFAQFNTDHDGGDQRDHSDRIFLGYHAD